ncbi:MAG: SUMF1/EgtB/PvdO family nonheme iron enzyme, partial [Bacteroidetes bacterium]|nr:SUMF1/EgtB/PvdO family nonheme iron enzyme [Bacteroidota bacterium]
MKLKISLFTICVATFLMAFKPQADNKAHKKAYKKFEKAFKNFSFIPGAAWQQPTDTTHPISTNWKSETVSVQSFFMQQYEVTNAEWHAFVAANSENRENLLPDTSLWEDTNEPMRRYYYSHPAFQNYPVVNISLAQAQAYCRWLAKEMTASKDVLFDSVSVSIPTEMEWEYAARGGHDFNKYPWGGPYVRNAKGQFLANFLRVPEDEVRKVDGDLVLKKSIKNTLAASIPAPIKVFYENDFGLYDMGGNVAEFVLPNQDGIHFTKGGSFYDP